MYVCFVKGWEPLLELPVEDTVGTTDVHVHILYQIRT